MEKAVVFHNHDGLALMGIYHEPNGNALKTGILFVHGGSQGRLGHTNQYVFYARQFARRGFPCLRFDPSGLGDSEGIIGEIDRRDFFGSIQTGRYVADVQSALEEFSRYGVERVVLFGLCGGAITALLSGCNHRLVSGMILLSCPVMIDGAEVDYNARLELPLARKETCIYLKKIFDISAIKKFVTFKTDYKRLFNTLYASVRTKNSEIELSGSDKYSELKGVRLNRYFFDAYKSCDSKKILWIYGANDGFWFEFNNHATKQMDVKKSDKLHLIPNGNHMFTLPEWQHEICEVSLNWLIG
jgi:pimeloyl-ACP methyl ester carboxylesterase